MFLYKSYVDNLESNTIEVVMEEHREASQSNK